MRDARCLPPVDDKVRSEYLRQVHIGRAILEAMLLDPNAFRLGCGRETMMRKVERTATGAWLSYARIPLTKADVRRGIMALVDGGVLVKRRSEIGYSIFEIS